MKQKELVDNDIYAVFSHLVQLQEEKESTERLMIHYYLIDSLLHEYIDKQVLKNKYKEYVK